MSELTDQAVKEGISLEKDAKPAESSPAKPDVPVTSSTSPDGGAKPAQVTPEDNLPFHKHPKWQSITTENKRLKQEFDQLRHQHELTMARLEGMSQIPKQTSIPDEQKQAILQLAQLIKDVPEARELLGLSKNEELEKSLNELRSSRNEEMFGKEKESVLEKYSKEYGLDKSDVEEELVNFIDSDPLFSKLDYSPGTYERAATIYFSPKMSEMMERAANLKLIKEKEAQKKANSEAPGSKSDGGISKPVSMRERLQDMIRDGGGAIEF